jgi:hypothetical protein
MKMKQILLLFPLIFASCSFSVCSNKEKAEEVMEYVANKFYEYNKSDILGQKRMCVVSKRKNNFHVFQVYTIFMCQEEFGYLRYNMKSLKPYKIKKKENVYFVYYDSQKEQMRLDQIPEELFEEVPLPYILDETEWQVLIDTTNINFAVFAQGKIGAFEVDTAKVIEAMVSDTSDFVLNKKFDIYKSDSLIYSPIDEFVDF